MRQMYDATGGGNVTVGEQGWLTDRFEEHRPRLRGVAYRMLGSLSEAEDAVQETWLRLTRIDTATVENLGGWLTTVVARVCLDMLRARNSRREEPIDARVAETGVVRGGGADPHGVVHVHRNRWRPHTGHSGQ